MLQFHPIVSPNSIFHFLKQNEAESQTWIVSDLKSKNEIQKALIAKQGFFLETSILRASDFWKIALRRLAPHIQVVSKEFIKIIVDNFVEKFGEALELKASESSTLAAYLNELAPILLHPASDSILTEWFSKQDKVKKWQRWHLLSRACMTYIVGEHKIIDSQWIASYLQTVDIAKFDWPNELVIDLGTEMSSVEMGLFRTLAQKIKVRIIWPEPSFGHRYSFLLKTYHDNAGYGVVNKGTASADDTIPSKHEFLRVSTQLAEVKFAVAQVRKWYDAGVSLDKIAIISSQIENYWPVLKYFLDEEGLIYQKDHVVKLNSLGFVQNFLAYCSNVTADVSWDSLETSLYSKSSNLSFNFENFKALFYQIYDESDLARDEKIKNLFYKKIDATKKIARSEFLALIVQFWMQTIKLHASAQADLQISLFETIFKDFLARSSDVQTYFNQWMQFLKSCMNSKELKIDFSQPEGVQVLPVMSSHLSESQYQVWLGLDEKSLSTPKKNLISTTDVFELKTQFDFAMDYPEESFYDFNTRWLFNKKTIHKIYLCANASFDAEPLTPSLFFLEQNAKHDVMVPGLTRHDEIQNYLQHINLDDDQALAQIDHYEAAAVSLLGLKKDFTMDINHVPVPPIESLSPSELEEYWKCPFKLLAQKIFKLKDLPQVAVDLDPRQKGSLLHHLFEHLVKLVPANLSLDELHNSMSQFLDEKRTELKVYPYDDLLWTIQKNKLMQVGTQFIEFENKRRVPATNKATEQAFELVYDLDKKDFFANSENSQHFIRFKGRIDRVDQTGDGLIIYDYKSSTSDLKNFGDWITHGEFQLLLYLLACEISLYPAQPVIASVYYDYRKFDFGKGFMLSEFHDRFLETLRKKKSLAGTDQKVELKQEMAQLLDVLMQKLNQFDFSAKPEDTKLCSTCNWNQICRAPHLM